MPQCVNYLAIGSIPLIIPCVFVVRVCIQVVYVCFFILLWNKENVAQIYKCLFDSQNCAYCVYSMVCVNGTAPLQWRHKEGDGVYNHHYLECLLNRLFRRGSKKTSKLRVTVPCKWNSSVTGEVPTQRASDAENVSIWRRHHVFLLFVSVSVEAVLYTPRCDMGTQVTFLKISAFLIFFQVGMIFEPMLLD